MKNRRAMILFLVLVLSFGGYLIFTYVIEPMEHLLHVEKEAYFTAYEQYNEIKAGILTQEMIDQKIDNFKRKMQYLDLILPNQIHQEEIILFLKDAVENNEIELQNISFSFDSVLESEEDKNKEMLDLNNSEYAAEIGTTIQIDVSNIERFLMNNQTEKEKIDDPLSYLSMDIDFEASYDKMKNFVDDIESFKSKAIVKNLSITKVPTELNRVTGVMKVSLPYYYDNGDLEILELEMDEVIGNTGPFSFRTDNVVLDTSVPKPKPRMTADFGVFLKSITSVSSTASINKYPLRYTALYADNENTEELNLWIKKEGENLYFRYGTTIESFPQKSGDFAEFVKFNEKLVLNVYSVSRGPISDNAGAHLNVYNTSGIDMIINVYGDDENKPRFKVTSHEGHFKTNRY